MIVLAVMTIIAAIGYPMYREQVLKSARNDSRTILSLVKSEQEKYRRAHSAYATSIAQLNYGPDGTPDGVSDTLAYQKAIDRFDQNDDGVPDNYNIVLNTDGDPTTMDYEVTATAIGDQADDTDCTLFRVNQIGLEDAEDDGGADSTELCW
ncbi:MAG: hypothetical protein KZQ80_04495 [Candidatus Thiodiazotropha sp. (ex Monitilora ramsayi)]|nr:hypothetical protein [Candidatus Thiodiazotropha sp. (ex Monitilora ramsayi)]